MKRFTDRVAVVTGAASGIGQAVAHELASRGCDIALVDLNTDGLAQTASIVENAGRRATVHCVDVSNRAQMEGLAAEIEEAHRSVDILVNNAGVSVAALFEEQSIEDLEWIVGINLWGVLYGCKLFLPLLRRSDDAYIVNLSSMFGLVGVPQQSSYCATKFAVAGLSQALAAELANSSVRVLSVHPGVIRTNIVRAARYRGQQSGRLRAKMIALFQKRAMSPQIAAVRIVNAIAQNVERLLITPEAHMADTLKRLYPSFRSRWISWAYQRFA